MDEENKPFDIVSIVILLIIAVANDGMEIVFDLLAMTGVGAIGEALMIPVDLVVDTIICAWFLWKVGLGSPSIVQFVGSALETVGIPDRTISVGLGIYIANHPSSFLAKGAAVAAAVEGGAVAGGMEGEAAEGLEGAASRAAQEKPTVPKETEAELEMPSAKGAQLETAEEERESEGPKEEKGKEDAFATDEERNPVEVAEKEELEAPEEGGRVAGRESEAGGIPDIKRPTDADEENPEYKAAA